MFLTGYKTYMAAVAMAGIAVVQWMGVAVPVEVWMFLNALGLGFLRAAVEEPK